MVQCISSTRFTMLADVLSITDETGGPVSYDPNTDVKHKYVQNPRTGAMELVWTETVEPSDDPVTTTPTTLTIPCEVKAVISNGVRAAGTTERLSGTYDNIDLAHMTFPAKAFPLSKRHRITNVRDARTGEVIWVEEELDEASGKFPATVFDVLGVSPITVPFLGHTENRAFLARVDLSDR